MRNTFSLCFSLFCVTNSDILVIRANLKGSSTTSNAYFKGNMYSVRLYNQALSNEEVLHNYLYDKQKFNIS